MKPLQKVVQKTESGYDKIIFKIKDKLHLFDPVFIYPYRGFGNQEKVYLHGRILEKEKIIHEKNELTDSLWTNLKKVWKRYESDEIPGVEIRGELYGHEAKAISDEEGYFTLIFEGFENAFLNNGWHKVNIEITHMPFDVPYEKSAVGEVLICEQRNPFGIISDVDDTVMKSDAMHPVKRIITMLKNDAPSRIPFIGVKELYNKLIDNYKNPLFFVSGSSYNLYDLITNFCDIHHIPKAPIFLRDLGFSVIQWIKEDTASYKMKCIETIFGVYDKLSFILIGDSGQEDPEIYYKLHKKHPKRVKAIYIRNVHTDIRELEIKTMSNASDIPFLIMRDSQEALDHATKEGYIN